MRKEPNIIITGTPGVGKTAHCEPLATNTSLTHIPINQFAEEHDCYDGRDEELGSWIVDEDKVGSPVFGNLSFRFEMRLTEHTLHSFLTPSNQISSTVVTS